MSKPVVFDRLGNQRNDSAMDFKVLIADSAIADLKEIVEFVAQDNADAATRLGEKLVERALKLGPHAATLRFL
jgi:hypothetical protein